MIRVRQGSAEAECKRGLVDGPLKIDQTMTANNVVTLPQVNVAPVAMPLVA